MICTKRIVPILVAISCSLILQPNVSAQISKYSKWFATPASAHANDQVNVTFFGVSSLLFDDGENQIMVDGFFTRPSAFKVVFGKLQTDTALVSQIIKEYNIHRLKGVFVTHSHYDHALDAGFVCATTGAALYGSKSAVNVGRGAGLSASKTQVFVPGKEVKIGKFSVMPVASRHSPPMAFNNDLGKQISAPLHQPAKAKTYSEGGTYDLLITHGNQTFLVKASANFVPGALKNLHADTVFLATATLGKQNADFQEQYYRQSVQNMGAKTVIPLHWDNFFRPLRVGPKFIPRIGDNNPRAFDFLIRKTQANGIGFKILLPGKSMAF